MPIKIEYAPRAALGGKVAAASGYGIYKQKQDELDRAAALRDAQLAQQRDLAVAGMQQRQQQAEAALADREQARMADLFDQDQRRNAVQQLAKDKADQAWQTGTTEYLEEQSEDALAAMQNKALSKTATGAISKMSARQLTPGGEETRNNLSNKLRGIQRKRGTVMPRVYNDLMGQWLEEVQESGIMEGELDAEIPVPKPTIEEYNGQEYILVDPEKNRWEKLEKADTIKQGTLDANKVDEGEKRAETARKNTTQENADRYAAKQEEIREIREDDMAAPKFDADGNEVPRSTRTPMKYEDAEKIADERRERDRAQQLKEEEREQVGQVSVTEEQAAEAPHIMNPLDLETKQPGDYFYWKGLLLYVKEDGTFADLPIRKRD